MHAVRRFRMIWRPPREFPKTHHLSHKEARAVELNINGELMEAGELKGRLLVYVLRDTLGLTGTRFGCGAGFCGSCTV